MEIVNLWAHERDKVQFIDLSNADLKGRDLSGLNLVEARLEGADLSGAKMKGANLTEADLTGVDLTGADLSRCDLTRARLVGFKSKGTDFSQSEGAEADLSDGEMFSGKITGNWRGARLNGLSLTQTKSQGIDLCGASMSKGWFTNCDFSGGHFAGIIGDGSDFFSCEFEEASFKGASLVGCDFSFARRHKARFEFADLREAQMDQRFGEIPWGWLEQHGSLVRHDAVVIERAVRLGVDQDIVDMVLGDHPELSPEAAVEVLTSYSRVPRAR